MIKNRGSNYNDKGVRMGNILEINSLSKNYPGFTLSDISLKIPYGYIMGLIGPNGSGKTTIIKLIMNLIKKESGSIKIFGEDHIDNEIAIKERIGFVYDTPNYYEHLTLEEMKRVIAPFYKQWDDVQFYRYISEFDLPLGKKIKALSRGMKMKFALVIALSHKAELMIMDEPTSGLDPLFRREILEILGEQIENGSKSVLFSTHITSDLERTADFITFIQKGKIVFSSNKEEIVEKWGVVKGEKSFLTIETKKMFEGIRIHEYGFEGLTSKKIELFKKYKNQLVFETPTLEDIIYFKEKGEKSVQAN